MNEEPKEVIVEVLSISSASDWFFGYVGDDINEAEPVMCFALIKAFNAKHPSIGASRQIIGLSANDLRADLIGSPLLQFRDVVHRKDLSTDSTTI